MSRPDESLPYHHYPSEVGSVLLQLYNKNDREFLQFLSSQKGIQNPVVSALLGGMGLPLLAEFLAT